MNYTKEEREELFHRIPAALGIAVSERDRLIADADGLEQDRDEWRQRGNEWKQRAEKAEAELAAIEQKAKETHP